MNTCRLLALTIFFVSTAAVAAPDVRRDSVVRIHATNVVPDRYQPWTTYQAKKGTGSGFVIEGERILTNAHVVAFADEILIESDKLPRKVPARVEFIAHGIDIAVLRVDEPGFFDLHPPVELASALPDDQEEITVFGYPMGGETMSTTVGVVSRVEYGRYWFSTSGIKIQVDAAINPGNSGGPAFSGDVCVGMVFSGFNEADNIGYAIPTVEIKTFLEDVRDGEYTGKAELDAILVPCENPDRRRRLGLGIQDSGMMVREAADETGLRRWDVVSEIDGVGIDDQGYGVLQGKRLRYPAIIENKAGNRTSIPLLVIRDGAPVSLTAGLTTELNERLLFPTQPERNYEYFIHGPFVFLAATQEHADLVMEPDWTPGIIWNGSPLATRYRDRKEFEDEQIVILASEPFPHKILRGYEYLELGAALFEVDGIKVRNIAHARELIRNHEGQFIVIEFADKFMDGLLTLDAKALASSTEDILEKNSIRKSASPGLE